MRPARLFSFGGPTLFIFLPCRMANSSASLLSAALPDDGLDALPLLAALVTDSAMGGGAIGGADGAVGEDGSGGGLVFAPRPGDMGGGEGAMGATGAEENMGGAMAGAAGGALGELDDEEGSGGGAAFLMADSMGGGTAGMELATAGEDGVEAV